MTRYRIRYVVEDRVRKICFEDSLIIEPTDFLHTVGISRADVSMFGPMIAAYVRIITPAFDLVEITDVVRDGDQSLEKENRNVRFTL